MNLTAFKQEIYLNRLGYSIYAKVKKTRLSDEGNKLLPLSGTTITFTVYTEEIEGLTNNDTITWCEREYEIIHIDRDMTYTSFSDIYVATVGASETDATYIIEHY